MDEPNKGGRTITIPKIVSRIGKSVPRLYHTSMLSAMVLCTIDNKGSHPVPMRFLKHEFAKVFEVSPRALML